MFEGTSNVRDFIPIIYFFEGGLVSIPAAKEGGKVRMSRGYFRGERGRFLKRAEEIASFFALYFFNFLII